MSDHRATWALLSCLAVAACGKVNAPGELLASSKGRVSQPAATEDLQTVVAGNTAFAIDVYRKLASTSSNVVFSPYSITSALAMTYGGAKEGTAAAFESTLHVTLPPERFHRAMNTIDTALRSRGQTGRAFRLSVENQLFAQTGFELVASFLDLLATEYGAGVRVLDFATAAEAARQTINAWVKTSTEGLIPELLAPDDVKPDTVLALVNTVYFNAAWMTKFEHQATGPADFELLDGTQRSVPTMFGKGLTGATAVVDQTEIVELPYEGDELAMVLLVPPKGQLGALEASLSSQVIDRFVGALQRTPIAVQLPKFGFGGRAELRQVLTDLGLGVAFSSQADFTGMSPSPIAIDKVVHGAVVRTDEDGTVAAAATAVLPVRGSDPLYLQVNRPFVFLIRERATGALVFMGRVVDPSQGPAAK